MKMGPASVRSIANTTPAMRRTAHVDADQPSVRPPDREVGADAHQEQHAGQEHGDPDVLVGGLVGGRATSVPFTAVLTGPQRTTTDNSERPRPAPFAILAGDSSTRSGFGSKGSMLPTWLLNYRKLRKSEHTDERSPGT